ncbi:MAG: MotA/TolQ/ExbB proton channel family protein [Phascolarctobacterium sp.]|uniref:MotA/TolQ/ExbB proton channel family protein n=1 Tax=Phascolarctobacterium sp. TaxID=2049039 RepID=UPI0026DD7425|nr:MotA/TolQ/ExbB proton channel family protein [Phascolarctobacterium sp.]MDO4921657.1 MotA/TolQ/ExbB proton channel family protein [Phascolarctobacterium sp.]
MDAMQQTIMYFHKGGLVMWPLLFCSLMVISIAIERFLFYKAADSGQAFTTEYCSLLRQNNIDEANKLAASAKGQCAQMVTAAAAIAGGRTQKQAYLESQAGIFIAQLRNRLDYLSIIVTMSPLLGLLGTIVGMIGAFSIFNLQAGAPLAITGGIGEALIATATGLCVAILSLCAHSYFAHRMDNIITNMEQCFSALLEAAARSDQ